MPRIKDKDKTKEQLVSELEDVRQRVAVLEKSEVEQKQAEEALRFQTEILVNMSEGVYLVGLNDVVIRYANPKFEEMFGYQPGEMVGRRASMVNAPTEKSPEERAREIMEVIHRMGEWHGEVNNIKKDGTPFWCYANVSVFDHSEYGEVLVAVHTDITKRKKLERDLNKRVKELTCLYGIQVVVSQPDTSLDTRLQRTVEALPLGWQYPNATCARIRLDGREYKTDGFVETEWQQSSGIQSKDIHYGTIDVFCSEEVTGSGQSPLSKEEEELLDIIAGIISEAIEYEQAKASLSESEGKYRLLFERSGDAIFLLDLHTGQYLDANAAAERLTGRPKAALITLTTHDISPVGADERLRQVSTVTNTCDFGEVAYLQPDGTTRTALLNVIHLSQQIGFGIAHDITERKQVEEELRLQSEIVAHAAEGVHLVRAEDAVIIFANPRFHEMFGYSQDELAGEHVSVLNAPGDRTAEEIAEGINRGLQKYGSWHGEVYNIRKDGTSFWCYASVSAFEHTSYGKVWVTVQEDITERKQLEEERQKAAKLESVGILAGGIAHDFNNLLTIIMGNIGLAIRHIEPGSRAIDRLMQAEKASERARDLTQQLLTFARGGEPIKKTVSISGLITDAASFALRGSNIRPEISIPNDLWSIEADEGQLNQVITNLLINADEAMPEGGAVNISARNTVIRDDSALSLPGGNYLEIVIEDSGTGISSEHLPRIFEPYFTTKQKGSGLGLATSYSIVKNHGGQISVESELGVGTTFHIYLPASRRRSPREKKTDRVQSSPLTQGRILVMDDEQAIRDFLYSELSGVGYQVELSSDGAEAIEKYTEAIESGEPFDTVILDLTVPGGMGGKETISKLLEIDPNTRAIVSSGYYNDPIMADYQKYGFSAVIRKPYNATEMETTLKNVLSGR